MTPADPSLPKRFLFFRQTWQITAIAIAWLMLILGFLSLYRWNDKLENGLKASFTADLYALPGTTTVSEGIPPETWTDLALHESVGAAEAIQMELVNFQGRSIWLTGGPLQSTMYTYDWLRAPEATALVSGLSSINPVYVSHKFAQEEKVALGRILNLSTPKGKQRLIVTGIFRDYTKRRGELVIERSLFSHWYQNFHAVYLSLLWQPRASPHAIITEWERRFPEIIFMTAEDFRKHLLSHTDFLYRCVSVAMGFIALVLAWLTLRLFCFRSKVECN